MRRVDDILYVNTYHPDYAGFILSEGFKRTVDIDTFYDLELLLNKEIKRVGVFVNEPTESILKYYADKLDVIQLHGEENAEYIDKLRENCDCEIWKAVRAKCADDIAKADALPVHKLLIDSFSAGSYGGTGKRVDLDVFSNVSISKPFLLAGGLNEEHVAAAHGLVQGDGGLAVSERLDLGLTQLGADKLADLLRQRRIGVAGEELDVLAMRNHCFTHSLSIIFQKFLSLGADILRRLPS